MLKVSYTPFTLVLPTKVRRASSSETSCGVKKLNVIKIRIRFALQMVHVLNEALGNEAVKQHAEHVLFEIPTIYRPA